MMDRMFSHIYLTSNGKMNISTDWLLDLAWLAPTYFTYIAEHAKVEHKLYIFI